MPESMLTVTFHHLVIEADFQIEHSGPIQEAMASWIERICFDCVEPTKRRFREHQKIQKISQENLSNKIVGGCARPQKKTL